jgi:hypothetical protein
VQDRFLVDAGRLGGVSIETVLFEGNVVHRAAGARCGQFARPDDVASAVPRSLTS